MELPEQIDSAPEKSGTRMLSKWTRVVLVVSLSINVFAFASISMYGTWLAAYMLDDMARGIAALFVWIATFGAGTVAFWKVVEQISAEGLRIA
ncbi:MAG: hypothetical protein JRN52_00445 [Nitrososphaerota archaeon]|nr:hypothetical protein [Nitrososphaerota archaeon]